MEVSGAGEQQPVAGAPREEIDLSLDDIIRRNQKGRPQQPNRPQWRQQLRNRNPASGNRRTRFQNRVPPALPGSSRFPRGFRKLSWTRKPFWGRMSGPGPRADGPMQGRSPLNRAPFAQQGKAGTAPLGRKADGAPADPWPEAPARAKAFKTAETAPPSRSNRPFRVNRRPTFLQSQQKFNFNLRQIKSKMEGKLSRMRMWRTQPNSGAVLTVSVSNPQAGYSRGPGPPRPFLRRRNSRTPQPRCQPRGVPLRFNFRAMANQTGLTLNERFSGLRHKHRFAAGHGTNRMVTLP